MRHHFAWQLTNREHRHIEKLGCRYALTARKVVQMVRDVFLSSIDPIQAKGDPVTIERPSLV
jgi:hypothetical protein